MKQVTKPDPQLEANAIRALQEPPQWFREAMAAAVRVDRIRAHAETKKAWPWWKRFLHWSLISWGCEACIEQRRKGLFRE